MLVFRSTCNVSQTFFFGFRTSSGSPLNPGNVTLSPTVADLGGSTNSTWIFFIKNLISVHVWWSRLKQAMTKPEIFFKVKLIQNQPWALMGIIKPFSETSSHHATNVAGIFATKMLKRVITHHHNNLNQNYIKPFFKAIRWTIYVVAIFVLAICIAFFFFFPKSVTPNYISSRGDEWYHHFQKWFTRKIR